MQAAKNDQTEKWITVSSKKNKKNKNKFRKCYFNECNYECACFEKIVCYKCDSRFICKCDRKN